MNTRSWTPAENEFFAEDVLIEIIPAFRGDKFSFVSGTFGPFKPGKPIIVPLWLAVYLKQRKKCAVQLPLWMDLAFLKKVRDEERELQERFSDSLPHRFFENAHLLLTHCKDDFADIPQTRSVLEDI